MKNTSNKISYISLTSQWADEKDDLLPIIERILSSGQYVGGDEIRLSGGQQQRIGSARNYCNIMKIYPRKKY